MSIGEFGGLLFLVFVGIALLSLLLFAIVR